jgi:glycosyltransferase involved in cell wall biosynthesis
MNSKKYNIAIDISPLSDSNSTRGVGFYTKNLIAALQHETKTNPDYKNFNIQLITNNNLNGYDLVHYPFFDPFKKTLIPNDISTIVTIHDLIPREFKKHFPVGLKGEINWQIQKYNLLKTDYIITVSNYSKFSIHKITKYPLDHIYVTYEAPSFKVPKFNSSLAKKIKTKYHLPNKFILFVGDVNWNKNIPSLVTACLKLNYPLVIVGKSASDLNTPDHPWTHDILWLQHQASINNLIKLVGFIPDVELPYFYKLATLYCQPSFAEGFGLTPVEAMACGCPVVYSQESSLWEVMDFNGLFFDPHSHIDLEQSLKNMWTNNKLRQKYSLLGLKRATYFNWQYTALQTLSVYQLALQNSHEK